jgi:hypothetical protein
LECAQYVQMDSVPELRKSIEADGVRALTQAINSKNAEIRLLRKREEGLIMVNAEYHAEMEKVNPAFAAKMKAMQVKVKKEAESVLDAARHGAEHGGAAAQVVEVHDDSPPVPSGSGSRAATGGAGGAAATGGAGGSSSAARLQRKVVLSGKRKNVDGSDDDDSDDDNNDDGDNEQAAAGGKKKAKCHYQSRAHSKDANACKKSGAKVVYCAGWSCPKCDAKKKAKINADSEPKRRNLGLHLCTACVDASLPS